MRTAFHTFRVVGSAALVACYNPSFKDTAPDELTHTQTSAAATATSASQTSSSVTSSPGTDPGQTTPVTTSLPSTTEGVTAATSADDSTSGPWTTRCERLGGIAGAEALATAVFDEILADDRINVYFLRQSVDKALLIKRFAALLLFDAECPGGSVPDGFDVVHAPYKISDLDFADFVQDAVAGFTAYQAEQPPPLLTADDQAWFVSFLQSWEPAVVSPDDTHYHELGRYPALLSASAGVSEDIAGDPMLSVMFDPGDSAAFATCLARYFVDLSAAFSPYGDEPLWYPNMPNCGMLSDDSQEYAQYPDITVGDFAKLLETYIRGRLTESAPMGADVNALIDAMWPLCPKVVTAFEEKKKCPGLAKDVTFTSEEFFNIPVNQADGTIESMTCVTMLMPAVADFLPYVAALEVVVDMEHQWAGEISIKVVNGGTIATMLLRPGSTKGDNADDCMYNGDCGTSANLGAPVRFKDKAAKKASAMGSGLGSADDVCKNVIPCEFDPVSPLTQFKGAPTAGPWKVCIGDHTNDLVMPTRPGSVSKVQLEIESVGFKP